jgi:hypothetical protein
MDIQKSSNGRVSISLTVNLAPGYADGQCNLFRVSALQSNMKRILVGLLKVVRISCEVRFVIHVTVNGMFGHTRKLKSIPPSSLLPKSANTFVFNRYNYLSSIAHCRSPLWHHHTVLN